MLYTTDPNSCSASFFAPLPEVSGGCQDSYEIVTQLLDEDGVVVYTLMPSDSRLLIGVSVGDYTLRYIVTDDCGLSTTQDCHLRVADIEEPTLFCQGGVVASLNGAGIAVAFVDQFLNGATDNCEVASVEIRRYYTTDSNDCTLLDTPEWSEWGSTVIFTCCDADQYITVELRATDIYGNINTCWVEVLVEDKTLPYCVGLDDVSIGCGSLPNDFDPYNTDHLYELFGGPVVIDNCVAGAIELELTVDWPTCEGGTILRRFIAVDQVGNESTDTLEQLVTIEYELSYAIRLAADINTECLEEVTGIEVFNASCDEIEVTYTDEFLANEDTECRFIERTYVITNLCEWDGQSPAIPVSRDEDCDGELGEEDVWILRDIDGAFIDADDSASNQLPAAGTQGDFCTGETNVEGYWRAVTSSGRWTYTQRIKIYDLTAPVIEYAATEPFCTTDESCEALVQIPLYVAEFCLLDELQINLFLDVNADGVADVDLTDAGVITGSLPELLIEGYFPIGNHAFEIVAQDGCLNTALATIPFSVVDCYIPEPTCYDGLIVNLEALEPGTDIDGDGEVDAAAVAVSAFQLMSCDGEDCSAPLQFSVNRVGEAPNPEQDMIYLTWDDRYSVELEVYVWDQAFNPYAVQPDGSVGGRNYRTCTVTVLVQDPDQACDYCQLELQIAGSVFNYLNDNPLQDIELRLEGPYTELEVTMEDGSYLFGDVLPNENYTIYPTRTGDDAVGITTLDMIAVQSHLLNRTPIADPYRLIAADVNNSGAISTMDILELRRLLLGMDPGFRFNSSWRFVASDYEFPDTENPWHEAFPESITHEGLQECRFDQNFIGIKIGDVNGSWEASATMTQGDDRSGRPTWPMMMDELELESGKTYHLPVRATDLAAIEGFQFTIDVDPQDLEILAIESGLLKEENWNLIHANRGIVPVSWHQLGTASEEVLFTLVVRAKANVLSSDAFEFSSALISAEAYTRTDWELMNVGLQFEGLEEPVLLLMQNYPNPVTDQTVIPFRLPEAGNATVTIYDWTGRKVWQVRANYEQGYHQIDLAPTTLKPGVYAYVLDYQGQRLSKEMVIIR